jgi:hypothetical protein
LSIDTVHENSGTGSTTGTTIVVSLAGADSTTAGNTMLFFLTSGAAVTTPLPTGAVAASIVGGIYTYRISEVAAGLTSWTFTIVNAGSTVGYAWHVREESGIDPVEPLEVSANTSFGGVANGGTRSTGTTALNAGLDTVEYAAFGATQAAGSTESWSGYSGDFEEVAAGASNVGGAIALAVARKVTSGTTGQFSSTATLATSQGTTTAGALILVFRAADSPIVAPLAMFAGFEQGTHGGITANPGATGTDLMGLLIVLHGGTWGTNYLIQAGSARNSNYGLRIVQTGASAYVTLGRLSGRAFSFGLDARVVSATGTVVVAHFQSKFQIVYDTSTTKFGVRAGTTGTVSWQSGTTALNAWAWIDLRVKISTSTWRVEWRIEESGVMVDQAAAELTGQSTTATSNAPMHLGINAVQTMTADYDNVCLSSYWVAYPLTPHQIRLLTVDPGGTPTVSGTSTNFSRFTANGTLAAINAATAALLVDEVPVTVSAAADGVCQTAVAASDYIEFPMAAPTLADDEIIVGVRMLAAMWDGTGTGTGTIGIRGWDGTTETILIDTSVSYDAGSPTAVSSTEPYWQTAMWPSPNGWTQAEVDALALRFGFSTDATPDMGVHVLYLEYATRKARTDTVIGEAGSVVLESNVNPNTAGVRSLVTTTPSDQGTTLNWTDAGGPHTQPVAAASTDTQTLDAGAGEVTFVEVVSGNELADRE